MKYVLVEWDHDLDDEPYLIYSELDDHRYEKRRVEFYRNGITFSYGEERGNEGALASEPFPEDLRTLRPEEMEGDFVAQEISPSLFYEIWNQSRERPDGFMGMFF
ncbi:MAG: hypothetical protein HFG05_07915 [Oscillibacter sp.]|nr:hypothetical protein [Oscillibacter sp.]